MISVFFLATLIFLVEGNSLRHKRDDWSPILEHTGGLSGYVGAEYQSDDNWHLGAAVHGDLNKEGIVDGARVQGGYQFDNGAELSGYVEGYDGGGVGAGIQGSYQFDNGVEVEGYLRGHTERGVETGVGVRIPIGKRSVSCVPMCYEECKQDFDCLERCVLTFC